MKNKKTRLFEIQKVVKEGWEQFKAEAEAENYLTIKEAGQDIKHIENFYYEYVEPSLKTEFFVSFFYDTSLDNSLVEVGYYLKPVKLNNSVEYPKILVDTDWWFSSLNEFAGKIYRTELLVKKLKNLN